MWTCLASIPLWLLYSFTVFTEMGTTQHFPWSCRVYQAHWQELSVWGPCNISHGLVSLSNSSLLPLLSILGLPNLIFMFDKGSFIWHLVKCISIRHWSMTSTCYDLYMENVRKAWKPDWISFFVQVFLNTFCCKTSYCQDCFSSDPYEKGFNWILMCLYHLVNIILALYKLCTVLVRLCSTV